MCSHWCTGRRAVGREHSPEEFQCWRCGSDRLTGGVRPNYRKLVGDFVVCSAKCLAVYCETGHVWQTKTGKTNTNTKTTGESSTMAAMRGVIFVVSFYILWHLYSHLAVINQHNDSIWSAIIIFANGRWINKSKINKDDYITNSIQVDYCGYKGK